MKPVKCGLDFIRDKNWKPKKVSAVYAQIIADRMASKALPKHFWKGVVADFGTHYRISLAGQPTD